MIKATLKGAPELAKQLESLPAQSRANIVAWLKRSAIAIHGTAVRSIQEHRSAGRTYYKGKNRDIVHVASAPGSPPNTDTGQLASSITFSVDEEALTATVGSGLDYALYLEVGTSRMAPRPWLAPAVLEHRATILTTLKLFSGGEK